MTQFRDAVAADLPTIVALLADDIHGQGREQSGGPVAQAYVDAFRAMESQGGRVILAVADGVIVGCLQFNVIHSVSLTGQSRAQIESVRVAGARRGQGVGAALMRFAIEEARRSGCGLVQLTTRRDREAAFRFYRRLGFDHSHSGMKLDLNEHLCAIR